MTKLQLIEMDPYLQPYEKEIARRVESVHQKIQEINKDHGGMDKFTQGYNEYGFVRNKDGITYREWCPNAQKISLIGEFSKMN